MENQSRESKFELSILGALGFIGKLILYVLIIFGALVIFLVPIGLLIGEFTPISLETLKESAKLVSGLVFYLIAIAVAVKKAKKMSDNNFKIEYIGKLNYKLLLSIIFLMIGYYFWYHSSIGVITDKIPLPEFLKKAEREMELHPYSAFFSLAIRAPIFEEIFMRGIILTGLLNRYRPKKAIIISALIFGISHFNIVQSVNTTLIGLVLGLIYYKTNSLILCIAAHMTNNIFAMIMGGAKEYMGYSPNIISFVVGVLIFTGSAILFFQYLKELDKKLEINKLYKNQEVL